MFQQSDDFHACFGVQMKRRLLLVEDEENLMKSLSEYLKKENFEISSARTVDEARSKINKNCELVILDWTLPDGEGIELLREWKKAEIVTPFIFLTARADTIDKVLGLELG